MKYFRKIFPAGIDDVPKIFCWVAFPFGLLLACLSPPFQAMDERSHTLRVYQLSMGRIIPIQKEKSLGDYLPESLWVVAKKHERFYYNSEEKVSLSQFKELFFKTLKPSQTLYTPFTNTALYCPIMYVPHLPGVLLGRLLELPPLLIMYLGRVTGLFTYVFMIGLALKTVPIGRWLFFLIAVMPVSLYVGSSVHTDGIIIGFCMLFFSMCLRIRNGNMKPSQWPQVALCSLGIGISLCKMAYLPSLLAVFLIPKDKFSNRKDWLRFLTSFWVVSILAYLAWGIYSLKSHTLEWEGVNAKEQIIFILNHPLQYVGILWGTLVKIPVHFLMTMVGSMGHLDAVITIPHFMSFLFCLLFTAIVDEDHFPNLSGTTRGMLFLIPILNLAYVMTAIYVTAVSVGKANVSGINGRYIIPVLPLLLLALSNGNIIAKKPLWHRTFILMFICYSLLSTLWTIYQRYYVL